MAKKKTVASRPDSSNKRLLSQTKAAVQLLLLCNSDLDKAKFALSLAQTVLGAAKALKKK